MVHPKFIYRIGSISSIIGRPPVLYRSVDLIPMGCKFGSVYATTDSDAQAIKEAGTAAGYRGVVWSSRLWLDIDTKEGAQAAQRRLKEMGYEHVVYTTGNRGCHIGVSRATSPSHVLPLQDKLWAASNVPEADQSLYWHLHLIRLPGTVHEATGLPKRLLYKHPGRELVLPPIEPIETMRGSTFSADRGSLFRVWEVMSKLGVELPEGERHRHLVLLAKSLRDEGKADYNDAVWMLLEVNRGFNIPKDAIEIERIAKWAYGI